MEEMVTGNAEIPVTRRDYTYDGRGNLIGERENGELLHGYEHGAINRLTRAHNSRGEEALYFYNGLGQRVGREANGERENYLLDLTKAYHNLLSINKGEKNQTFYWDNNVTAMEEESDGLQELHYYLQDELGSPLRVSGYGADTDLNATRGLKTVDGCLTYGYDEFGNDLGRELEKSGIPNPYTRQGEGQPFGYTGYRYDNISSTYFAQAREYKPESGRFVKKDADFFIKFDKTVSLNQYIYCNENPINYIDWSGNDSYVFYDPLEFEKQAIDEKERLEKCYGDTVHLIPIDSNEELKEIWNQEVVEEKSVDEISLLFHGQPHALIINQVTNSVFTTNESGKTNRGTEAIYIGELEVVESINKINLLSCNVGHVEHHNNVASTFLELQNVEHVLAWDGSTVYNKQFGFRDYGIGRYVIGLSRDQSHFHSWTRKTQVLFWELIRSPYGQVDYYMNEQGEIEVSMMIGGRGAEILYSILTEGYKEECCGC